jgi:hypothetical protein
MPSSHGGFSSRLHVGAAAGIVWGVRPGAEGPDAAYDTKMPPRPGAIELSVRGAPARIALTSAGRAAERRRARRRGGRPSASGS